MSFELIASDIDAALNNIHQAEADHNMNTFFDELLESGYLSSSNFFSIVMNFSGETDIYFHQRWRSNQRTVSRPQAGRTTERVCELPGKQAKQGSLG